MLQKDLSAATGLSQSKISVRLSMAGASMPVHDLVLFCGALGLDLSETLAEAGCRAEQRAQSRERPADPSNRWASGGWVSDADPQQQVNAVARQLATALWNGADSWDFINIAIEETVRRENEAFWTEKRKRWVLEIALAELAYSIGRRNPIRDPFPLKPPRIDPEAITR
jgi:hypothetical protein